MISDLYCRIYARLDAIDRKLDLILAKQKEEIMDITLLTSQVATNTSVEQSALTLIQGLAARLAAITDDPAAVQTLVDELNASGSALAAAVAANTPAAA